MKSKIFKNTTSIAITTIMTVLIISSAPSNIIQLEDVNAQEHALPTTISSKYTNMMSMYGDYLNGPLSDGGESNFTSSVSIFKPIINAFKSYIQVDIVDAIATAQQSVGNNATTIAAYIHPEGQFIVYNIFVIDSDGNFHRIIVDPGNGQIINSEQISFIKMMKLFHGGGSMIHSDMMGGHEGGIMGPSS